MNPTTQQKTADLFKFLAAVKRMDIRTETDTKSYELLLSPEALAYPNVHVTQDEELFIEVHFLSPFAEKRPSLPRELYEYVLQDGETYKRTELFPEKLDKTFNDFLASIENWEQKKTAHESARKLYDTMYRTMQLLSTESDTYELVYSFGMLHWPNDKIERPLFTRAAVLEFDQEKSLFRIEASAIPTKLELDMLDRDHVWMSSELSRYEVDFKEELTFDFKPWIETELKDQSERVLKLLHDDHVYGEVATVYAMPGMRLYVRKKSAHAWVEEHENLATLIEDGLSPSPALQQFLTSSDEEIHALDALDRDAWKPVGEEILFPLPYNEEQKRILSQLSNHAGVVVQGPPGTGKSHTISNLISHLLAHGKRVLVTSEKEHALNVLRDKLPAQIRQLAVSVLGSDSKTTKQTESSLQAIASELNRTTALELENKGKQKQQKLYETREEIARLRRIMIEQAASEHTEIPYLDETRSPTDWAKWTSEQKVTMQLPVPILTDTCPMTADELADFYQLMAERNEINNGIDTDAYPSTQQFLDSDSYARKAKLYHHYSNLADQYASLEWLFKKPITTRQELLQHIEKLLLTVEESPGWVRNIYQRWVSHRDDYDQCERDLKQFESDALSLEEIERQITLHEVIMPSTLPENFWTLVEELGPLLDQGKTNGFFFKLMQRKRYTLILDEVKIDGKVPKSSEDLMLLKQLDEYKRNLTKLTRQFSYICDHYQFELETPTFTSYRMVRQAFRESNSILPNYIESIVPVIQVYGARAFRYDEKWLRQAKDDLEQSFVLDELKQLQQTKEKTLQLFTVSHTHQAALRLKQAVMTWDEGLYTTSLKELKLLEEQNMKATRLKELTERIKQVAPGWLNAFYDGTAPTLQLQTFELDWKVARVLTLLEALSDDDYREKMKRLEKEEGRATADLCATYAWKEQLTRMTPSKQERLNSWAKLIRQIGKGTGKHAARHKREAARQMAAAQDAIPVWIMPVNRVLESFKEIDELFDVIIFDESSQSTMDAISLLSRARKAIIVGDDRQISPTTFQDQNAIQEKKKTYFGNDTTMTLFDGSSSLYDLASVKFSATVGLREHFRCVPEIIGFSNAHVYEGRIVPLRLPQRAERLTPAVQHVFVEDGNVAETTKDKFNVPEAKALVNHLKQLINDPRYAKRTFGVISLLGKAQTDQIERMATDLIGIDKLIEHNVRFGDAYTFQGDERDVMLLSLVIAPNRRFTALTKETDSQRFNVAASRARDQMILFHSVTLQDIGNQNCMRYKLVNYCQNPLGDQESFEAAQHLFDSPFEEEVYKRLTNRGYLVRPQVQVNGYRIDLVVEGESNRLAVECDGERWHGPDVYEQDMFRQKVLERAGWTFWRVRGRHFYRDAEQAMEPLWTLLDEMGIEPIRLYSE
ncbi:AAA domain-containing protein [Exiguobacterium sp. s183]|uniref:AAA domain-containing protein n=1 Tax=Exiguobacterium sp. s183 TaxID=2751262 RepID=UPI001BE9CF2D|nr:AAA domain-containing protein [Exiguobacterium sp. s183]